MLSFVCRVVSFGVLPYLILWLSGMLGYSPLGTGLRLLAMTAFIMLVAPFSGLFLKLMPTRGVMALGTGITAVGLLTMARVGPDDSWLVMLPGLVLLRIGGAIAFPPLTSTTRGSPPCGSRRGCGSRSGTPWQPGSSARSNAPCQPAHANRSWTRPAPRSPAAWRPSASRRPWSSCSPRSLPGPSSATGIS
ncbi:hypothetical protein [Streptomyces sp. ATCC 21386]|uniref:hypothetical protein n=1 Tax=Streptomyces sp. ATCC 21386 TaxID=2699428 RepID=UPI001BFF7E68|nr:hypothetical protein [Streptomyces sp. ATCC 21386]